MSDIDSEADALLKRWNAQQASMNAMNPQQQDPQDSGSTDQSPHLTKQGFVPESPDQTPPDPVNSVRPMNHTLEQAPPTMPAPNPGLAVNSGAGGAGGVCSQCGTMHPPVPPGQDCPLKSVADNPDTLGGLDDQIINKHLVDMRNIIIAQISSKGIKDGKKFFQYAVIELTKALESYNE